MGFKTVSKSSQDRSVDFTSGGPPFSERTIRILQFLASKDELQRTQEIADSVGISPKTAHKYLRRLVKKGLVLEPLRGLFRFNHDHMALFIPYGREVSISRCYRVSPLGVHRVGLKAETPGIFDRMLESGSLHVVDLAHVKQYMGRSLVFDADLRISPDSAYYLRACEPVLPRTLPLMLEDLRKSLAYHTRDLVDVKRAYVGDLELGVDGPDFFYEQPSRIIIYPKRGRVRIHVEHKDLDLSPLPGPQEETYLRHMYRRDLEDSIVTLTEAWLSICEQIGGPWTPKIPEP